MKIKLLIILIGAISLLTACGSTEPKVIEKPVLVDRPTLMVQDPQPAEQYEFEWVVITKDTAEAKFKELEGKGVVVLFALTPQGYQNLAMGGAELRRYIQQQHSVIAAYKQYYDKPASTEKPKEEEKLSSGWKLW
jgi:hypothetical protein